MSKKPVPSKKQAVSSTRSRFRAYVHKMQTRLQNWTALDDCSKCGAKKRRHFACGECGFYGDKQILTPKTKSKNEPIQEIEA